MPLLIPQILHHGAVDGVTGSCHEYRLSSGSNQLALLIDCGLFQGEEKGSKSLEQLEIDFDIQHVSALIVTHVHIDHVGRIPYLLAAGFSGPIYCTQESAHLLTLVIEDALKVGFTRDKNLINQFLKLIKQRIVSLPYGKWHKLTGFLGQSIKLKFKPAGHILGSAYVELETRIKNDRHKTVFSGDLGAAYTPLLPAPKSPYSADILVIESTYGDKDHQGRRERTKRLEQAIVSALQDDGTVLIPAFSIGRTQELLYEIEALIHKNQTKPIHNQLNWQDIQVIVDSPLAAKFTQEYRTLKSLWDNEAKKVKQQGRHPLNFEQVYTVDDHQTHLQTVNYLASTKQPAIVIAASGMCEGGRIVNYLKAMLSEPRHNVLFVGYQAKGSIGRSIQQYGPQDGYVIIDDKRYWIKAGIETISGYSAHADQSGLINFVKRMRHKPKLIKIVHGDEEAKQALKEKLEGIVSTTAASCEVMIAGGWKALR
jgi:metallo-beta-lactamase family protein